MAKITGSEITFYLEVSKSKLDDRSKERLSDIAIQEDAYEN